MADSSILILEDEEILRGLIVDTLEDEGLSSMGVGSAVEAVMAAEQFPFDLIVSDIRMAGKMDGLGALEVIKGRLPYLRCVVMTGYADTGAPIRALNIEVDDYLYKPFEPEELLRTVKSIRTRGKMFGAFGSWMSGVLGNNLEQKLEDLHQARSACFRFLWVAIRSKILEVQKVDEVLAFWDKLEDVEMGYFRYQLQKKWTAATLDKGLDMYRGFLYGAKRLVEKREPPRLTHDRRGRVGREPMKVLITGVRDGKVSLEDLHLGVYLFKMTLAERTLDNDMKAASERLWGNLQKRKES